jgi:hypothetical protein
VSIDTIVQKCEGSMPPTSRGVTRPAVLAALRAAGGPRFGMRRMGPQRRRALKSAEPARRREIESRAMQGRGAETINGVLCFRDRTVPIDLSNRKRMAKSGPGRFSVAGASSRRESRTRERIEQRVPLLASVGVIEPLVFGRALSLACKGTGAALKRSTAGFAFLTSQAEPYALRHRRGSNGPDGSQQLQNVGSNPARDRRMARGIGRHGRSTGNAVAARAYMALCRES